MLKALVITIALFLLAGCATKSPSLQTKTVAKVQNTHKKIKNTKKTLPNMHKMFQSVAKKDAVLLQKGQNRAHCSVCGMNLVMFYKTSHAATDMNGTIHQYCSLHCLADALRHGAELENPMVIDVKTLKFIPVTEAFYVVGSDVPGTMSRVSKYAFKNLDDAKAFQKKHGGKIVDFYSAWQEAKKDFKK